MGGSPEISINARICWYYKISPEVIRPAEMMYVQFPEPKKLWPE